MFERIFNISQINNKVVGLSNELKSIYTYNTFKQLDEAIVLVCNSLYEANKLYQSLIKYTDQVLLFPMDDFLTSEALAISPELEITRLETLNELIVDNYKIIVTNLMGYLRFLPDVKIYKQKYLDLKLNQIIKIDDLVSKLIDMGYVKETIVNKTGEIAVRGFVVDIFPIDSKNPIRIEFWGDQIETIKEINVDTQLTINKITSFKIGPKTEFLTDQKCDITNLKQKELPQYTKVVNINAYLKDPIVIFNNYDEIINSYNLLEQEMDEYTKNTQNDKNTKYMHNLKDIVTKKVIYFTNFDDEIINVKNIENYNVKNIEPFKGTIEKIKK